MSDKKPLECSFCGKRQDQVKKLVAGPNVFICDECIDLCYDIMREDDTPAVQKNGQIPSPREIKQFMDEYIIGQNYAKMVVAVAVHNHYRRLQHPKIDDVELDKSNLVLLGPSGTGKCCFRDEVVRVKIDRNLADILKSASINKATNSNKVADEEYHTRKTSTEVRKLSKDETL